VRAAEELVDPSAYIGAVLDPMRCRGARLPYLAYLVTVWAPCGVS
jgi:hypothetical protein